MTEHQQQTSNAKLIEREAIAWFTRMNGKPSVQDRRDFQAWLQTSADHRSVYEDVCRLWATTDTPAKLAEIDDHPDLAEPLEKIHRLRTERQGNKTGPIIVGCLAILVAGIWIWLERPNLLQDMRADFVSPRGERREITLQDGSHVLMDADSALSISMSGTERRVRLLRGTAFFEVTHVGTPFTVEAQHGAARVLGTEFDVSMKEDREVTVTLAKGSVAVGIDGMSQKVVLSPGESVDYGDDGLGSVRKAILDDEMAWHNGRFIFNNARLADVLAQIERYRAGRIVVVGHGLGELRVSGNIALDNTDKALAAVQSSVGFRMHSLGKLTIVGP
ncbi:FecR family protein [Neorhizobium sp. NCHU2750]|uniref:FecR family protein n=1 Tax=Neorhizobium sp. NCHU2750 TaxID=1825976 RepID=UPI000E74424E|nr:hypothetical protein NCHU2750_48140 [Neorhizobium sp. NCHU2750]